MTLTQRRVRAADPSRPDDKGGKSAVVFSLCYRLWSGQMADLPLATEPGIKYTCDTCESFTPSLPGSSQSFAVTDTVIGGVDITHSVRIKCAHKECEEIDLCVPCFLEGKELQQHKAWHPYKVVVRIPSHLTQV